jgi:hypothetical protein
MNGLSKPNPEREGVQWDTSKVNAPYFDGGGKYSKPRGR